MMARRLRANVFTDVASMALPALTFSMLVLSAIATTSIGAPARI